MPVFIFFVIFFARTLFSRGVFLFLKTVTIYGKKMSWPRVFNLFSAHSTALEGHERKKTGDSTQSTRAVVGGMGGGDCVRAMDTFPEIKICLRSTMNEGLR